MFGNIIRSVIGPLCLIGFCIHIIRLYITDNIVLYIHPRYTVFAFVMSVLAIILLLCHLYFVITGAQKHHRHKENEKKGYVVNGIVLFVLLLAVTITPTTLSTQAVVNKQLTSTLTESSGQYIYNTCPPEISNSINQLVEDIRTRPLHCYKGKSIELKGFVYTSVDKKLPDDMYFLGRIVISCCVIDARPFAIPILKQDDVTYAEFTWLNVKGTLQPKDINGTVQLVVVPEQITEVEGPKNPYEYIQSL